MRIARNFGLMTLVLAAAPVLAQDGTTEEITDPVFQAAVDSGICGEATVATAVLNTELNQIEVTCNEDVEGFVPLVGGLGPLFAGGAAVVLAAAAGGGGAPSDTQ